jgi:hypothetical protein
MLQKYEDVAVSGGVPAPSPLSPILVWLPTNRFAAAFKAFRKSEVLQPKRK